MEEDLDGGSLCLGRTENCLLFLANNTLVLATGWIDSG
jgi:hypothetical protein